MHVPGLQGLPHQAPQLSAELEHLREGERKLPLFCCLRARAHAGLLGTLDTWLTSISQQSSPSQG